MGSEDSPAGGQPAHTRTETSSVRPVSIPQPRGPRADQVPSPDGKDDFTVVAPGLSRLQLLWPPLGLALACLGINLGGRGLVELLNLPVHLDMIGTAVAAIILGPLPGVAVGASTNALSGLATSPISFAFIAVNVAGALVWAYGVRKYRMGRSLADFLRLNLIVAAVCAIIATPIIYAYNGYSGHASDTMLTSMTWLKDAEFFRLAISSSMTAILDMLVAGFLALAIIAKLPIRLRRRIELPLIDNSEVD